jgi:Lanthionine-containing peptide SapB precursor RamS
MTGVAVPRYRRKKDIQMEFVLDLQAMEMDVLEGGGDGGGHGGGGGGGGSNLTLLGTCSNSILSLLVC